MRHERVEPVDAGSVLIRYGFRSMGIAVHIYEVGNGVPGSGGAVPV